MLLSFHKHEWTLTSNYNSIIEKHSVWEIIKDLHIQSQTCTRTHARFLYLHDLFRQSSRPNRVTHSSLRLGEGSLIRSELTPPPQHPVRALLNNVEEPEWYRKCSLCFFLVTHSVLKPNEDMRLFSWQLNTTKNTIFQSGIFLNAIRLIYRKICMPFQSSIKIIICFAAETVFIFVWHYLSS